MYITANRRDIHKAEYMKSSFGISILSGITVLTVRFFNESFTLQLTDYFEIVLCAAVSFIALLVGWWKCQSSGSIRFRDPNLKSFGKKCTLFGFPGIAFGLFYTPILAVAIGVCVSGLALQMGIIPFRRTKWLDTWHKERWSIEELTTVLEEDDKLNPILKKRIEEELESRNHRE